jgi:hypothetical protein
LEIELPVFEMPLFPNIGIKRTAGQKTSKHDQHRDDLPHFHREILTSYAGVLEG